jgi:histidinol-phosphate aminotransferase
VEQLPVYRSGPAVRQPAGRPVHRSSLNEHWYPPLPSVLAAVAAAAGQVNRYPDLYGDALAAVLAERLDRPAAEVVVGPGSNALLLRLLAAACGPGDEVVHAWRSFEAYPIDVQVAGAVPVPVPLTPDLRHDLPAMAAAVGPRTRAVLLCSPNNPTGPALRTDQVEAFLRAVPADLLVVLDEAYRDFSRDPGTVDGVALGRRHRNVVALRTFSKAHGLAGLRVGYAVGPAAVTEAIRAMGVPFAVPDLAQAAALASLQAEAELAERVAGVVAERERILAGLRAQGWEPPESQANFVWLPLGEAAAGFGERCAGRGLLVRVFDGEGVRCTVGPPEAGDLLLEVAGQG